MSDTRKSGDDVEALIARVLTLEESGGRMLSVTTPRIKAAIACARHLRSVLEELERVKKERDEKLKTARADAINECEAAALECARRERISTGIMSAIRALKETNHG
jgi:hypothetical protein